MTIRFQCPAGHTIKAAENRAGQSVHCPACKAEVQVPAVSENGSGGTKPPPLPSAATPEPTPPSEPSPKSLSQSSSQSTPSSRRKSKRARRDGTDQRTEQRERERHPPEKEDAEVESESSPAEPLEPPKPKKKRPRRRWFARRPKLVPADAYRADVGHIQSSRLLALLLSLAVAFSVAPALRYINIETAPGWARTALLLGAIQLFFIAWMLNAPDWASVWVVMLVFAGVSTLYGAATAVAIATPLDKPMILGMGEVRASAGQWCGAVLMVNSLATYLCGRTSSKWHRTFELEMAGLAKGDKWG